MFTVKTEAEFISDVRAIDEKLKSIRVSSIEIDKKNFAIKYNFICSQTVDEELKQKILAETEKITGKIFKTVEITVAKIVSNDQLINNEIFNYLNKTYPSISIFLKPTDVISTVYGDTVKYVLRLTKDGVDYVQKNGVIYKINEIMAKKFCSDFAGTTEEKEAEESIDIITGEAFAIELEKIEHRTIKVKDIVTIDDPFMGDTALYIEDALAGDVVVCGKITEITERKTKNDKPFFIIHIDDTTGTTSGVYFSKKSTINKIKNLKVGDAIITRGNIGEYNGRRSFTFDKINYCVFPEDFVKKDKYKKSAPKTYKTIFPSAVTTVKISSVFDDLSALPSELTGTEYVVFDLETTGLDVLNNGITEIGAVRIKDGKITEQFGTLIKPDYPITEEITKITGITEEMVKDSPKISTVMPDFMKFIDGAVLVAHNAEFDMKFIKRFAGAEEYEIKNKVLDTVEIARSVLPFLKRHDLHTIAEHFNIAFNHHRAVDDATATAQAFIEMYKIKYKKG